MGVGGERGRAARATLAEPAEASLRRESDELIRANQQLRATVRELRAVEDRLRTEREMLARAEELAGVGSYDWDLARGEIRWSGGCYRIHGYEPGEVVPSSDLALERIHPEDRPRIRSMLDRALETGRAHAAEYRIVRPDGEERIVCGEAEVLRDDAGRATRMLGVLQDVTESRAAAEAARRSAEQLRLAVDAAGIGVWTYDLEREAFVGSEGLPELLGRDLPSRFPGVWLLAEVVHPEDRDRVRAAIERLTWDGRLETELRILRPGGEVRWLLCRAEWVREGRRRVRLHGVTLDVTDRHRDEEERRELLAREKAARAEAEEANAQKDEFLATLSHELRTPLNSILGWVDLLRTGELDAAEMTEALDTIERNARRQSQLIADILEVSKIIQGKIRLERRPCAPWEFLEPGLKAMEPMARDRGVRLRWTLEEAGTIVVDPGRMQQVVANLLSNAIKFSLRGGVVDVELRDRGDAVSLSVRDEGEGIPEAFLPHVFERFRQADSSASRRHGGLGLGLAIVRHLVELHGGEVRAESQGPGRGARFTLWLPKRPSEAVAAPGADGFDGREEETAAVAREVGGLRVLVIDDEADTRQLLATGLGRFGVEVEVAGSVAEAFERIDARPPDVVVSDVGMPGEDGYALIRRLRARPASLGGRTPALALTAYAGPDDRRRLLEAGFQSHVTKPILAVELAREIGRLAREPAGQAPGGGVP